MKNKCEVEGCEGVHEARGLCDKHYRRLRKGADLDAPGRYDRSLEEKFKAKCGPQDPVTGCIEWTGCRKEEGYGQINHGGKIVYTHRLAWELKHGPIPPGMEVCHSCDNPPCCNDVHLYLGTHQENMADRDAKGRGNQVKGEDSGRSKLTTADVLKIRRLLAAGELQRVIAADFGVLHQTVSKIKSGKLWKHLID
jgi:hypothetical protein